MYCSFQIVPGGSSPTVALNTSRASAPMALQIGLEMRQRRTREASLPGVERHGWRMPMLAQSARLEMPLRRRRSASSSVTQPEFRHAARLDPAVAHACRYVRLEPFFDGRPRTQICPRPPAPHAARAADPCAGRRWPANGCGMARPHGHSTRSSSPRFSLIARPRARKRCDWRSPARGDRRKCAPGKASRPAGDE